MYEIRIDASLLNLRCHENNDALPEYQDMVVNEFFEPWPIFFQNGADYFFMLLKDHLMVGFNGFFGANYIIIG